MTKPLRRFLLNEQIAREARRIAHEHTEKCNNEKRLEALGVTDGTVPNLDDWHTPACNDLKRKIEILALQVKLSGIQPPIDRRDDLDVEPERAERRDGERG